ncbi:hypothetical protein SAMN06309944_0223 [Micrococcales bacterium KH10]|nr:hypothetical protein SAMN06309944_0223 [Micrococcales bacterium KH10]
MDLLDELNRIENPADVTKVHALMPSMGLACGLDFLKVREPCTLGTRGLLGAHKWPESTPAEPTCTECLARHGGLDGLRAEIRRQQSREAIT